VTTAPAAGPFLAYVTGAIDEVTARLEVAQENAHAKGIRFSVAEMSNAATLFILTQSVAALVDAVRDAAAGRATPEVDDEFGLGAVAEIAMADSDAMRARVTQLESDLRAAIDERDRAVADLAAERQLSDARAAEVEALRWAIDESGVLVSNGTLAQQLIAAAKRKLGGEP
jgi:hypothetical protein